MIKIWQSYSCNNSSSYRLIARFADPELASEVADEVDEFFRVHAAQVDADNLDSDENPTRAQLDLANRYGFTWTHLFYWGTGALAGNEPEVILEDTVVLVQHYYCGGFGDLLAYFERRGAQVDYRQGSTVEMTLLFRAVPEPALDAELATMFAQIDPADPNDTLVDELQTPWQSDYLVSGNVAWFRDAGTVGMYVPIDARDLANVKCWLAERTIGNPVLRIGERADLQLVWTVARARCTACGGTLDYLDPRLHDIETPQLVCKPCGGLYDLATFLPV